MEEWLKSLQNAGKRGKANKEAFLKACEENKIAEDHLRAKFQQGNLGDDVDSHELLVDVFEFGISNISGDQSEFVDLKGGFAFENANQKEKFELVDSIEEFKERFDLFSEGCLRFLKNWDNIIIAGGSVLACLTKSEAECTKKKEGSQYSFDAVRNNFRSGMFAKADVDIFLYSLNEEEAFEKAKEIYIAISKAIPEKTLCFRSKNVITIVSQFPYKNVQIVLRLYNSLAEVLHGFDVDCCTFAFDGQRIFSTWRALRALTLRANFVDMSRRSPSYEFRLAKYAKRGFRVFVPGLAPNWHDKIQNSIFLQPFGEIEGLARLVVLERFENPSQRAEYLWQQRRVRLEDSNFHEDSADHARFASRMWRDLQKSYKKQEKSPEEMLKSIESNYSTVFLPWGKEWDAKRVAHLMFKKDFFLNSPLFTDEKEHRHPCFIGSMEHVLNDCCGSCPPKESDDSDNNQEVEEENENPFVSGKATWKTKNPGAQMIGSFNPITQGDWIDETLSSKSSEILNLLLKFDTVNATGEQQKQLLSCSLGSLQLIDQLGRAALHLSVMLNLPKVTEKLVQQGAKIDRETSAGFTAPQLVYISQHQESNLIEMLFQSDHGEEEEDFSIIDQRDEVRTKRDKEKKQQKQMHLTVKACILSYDVDRLKHPDWQKWIRLEHPDAIYSWLSSSEWIYGDDNELRRRIGTCVSVLVKAGIVPSVLNDEIIQEEKIDIFNFLSGKNALIVIESLFENLNTSAESVNTLQISRVKGRTVLTNLVGCASRCENLKLVQLLIQQGGRVQISKNDEQNFLIKCRELDSRINVTDALQSMVQPIFTTISPSILTLLVKNGAHPLQRLLPGVYFPKPEIYSPHQIYSPQLVAGGSVNDLLYVMRVFHSWGSWFPFYTPVATEAAIMAQLACHYYIPEWTRWQSIAFEIHFWNIMFSSVAFGTMSTKLFQNVMNLGLVVVIWFCRQFFYMGLILNYFFGVFLLVLLPDYARRGNTFAILVKNLGVLFGKLYPILQLFQRFLRGFKHLIIEPLCSIFLQNERWISFSPRQPLPKEEAQKLKTALAMIRDEKPVQEICKFIRSEKVLIASGDELTHVNPLSLAVLLGKTDLFQSLLDLAKEQFWRPELGKSKNANGMGDNSLLANDPDYAPRKREPSADQKIPKGKSEVAAKSLVLWKPISITAAQELVTLDDSADVPYRRQNLDWAFHLGHVEILCIVAKTYRCHPPLENVCVKFDRVEGIAPLLHLKRQKEIEDKNEGEPSEKEEDKYRGIDIGDVDLAEQWKKDLLDEAQVWNGGNFPLVFHVATHKTAKKVAKAIFQAFQDKTGPFESLIEDFVQEIDPTRAVSSGPADHETEVNAMHFAVHGRNENFLNIPKPETLARMSLETSSPKMLVNPFHFNVLNSFIRDWRWRDNLEKKGTFLKKHMQALMQGNANVVSAFYFVLSIVEVETRDLYLELLKLVPPKDVMDFRSSTGDSILLKAIRFGQGFLVDFFFENEEYCSLYDFRLVSIDGNNILHEFVLARTFTSVPAGLLAALPDLMCSENADGFTPSELFRAQCLLDATSSESTKHLSLLGEFLLTREKAIKRKQSRKLFKGSVFAAVSSATEEEGGNKDGEEEHQVLGTYSSFNKEQESRHLHEVFYKMLHIVQRIRTDSHITIKK